MTSQNNLTGAPFIVFEGIDGAGKTTQAQELQSQLNLRGHNAITVHAPGTTPMGETVRTLVKTGPGLTPIAELFLFSAAHSQMVRDVIRPSLERGVTVISDRFTASTLAYQGAGRGLDPDFVRQVNAQATSGLEPDVTFLLDMEPAQALLRRTGLPGTKPDNFDDAPLAFQNSVRRSYLEQAACDPDRWAVIDAARPSRQIAQDVWERVHRTPARGPQRTR